jgi:hypothetical protein
MNQNAQAAEEKKTKGRGVGLDAAKAVLASSSRRSVFRLTSPCIGLPGCRDPGTIAEVPRRSRVKNRGGFPRRGVVARCAISPSSEPPAPSTGLGYGYFSTTVIVAFVLPVFVSMNTAFELEMMYMTLVSGAVPTVALPFDDTVYGAVNVCPATSVPI